VFAFLPRSDRILAMLKHVPNILTLGRLVLTVVFLVMVLYAPGIAPDRVTLHWDIAFAIFLIAGISDLVDGSIARHLNVASKFGRMMDPLADKVLVIGAFLCFAIVGEPKTLLNIGPTGMAIVRWGIAGIITAREVYMTIMRHIAESRGINFAATAAGKIKMALQSIAIGTVIVRTAHVSAVWGDWFTIVTFTLTALVTVVSAIPSVRGGNRV
jgi:CDP-diacylglycerol---glycerol-3-phosphate 3-phosphatidyltransferase